MVSKRRTKRKKRKRFIKKTLEILKIAETLAAVIAVFDDWV